MGLFHTGVRKIKLQTLQMWETAHDTLLTLSRLLTGVSHLFIWLHVWHVCWYRWRDDTPILKWSRLHNRLLCPYFVTEVGPSGWLFSQVTSWKVESAGQCLCQSLRAVLWRRRSAQNNVLERRAPGKDRRCLHHSVVAKAVLWRCCVTLNRPSLCGPSDLWLQDWSEYFHLFKNT